MSNDGKYIDRNPDMRTAGKLCKSVENVGDSLKIYSPEEAAFNIMSLKCKEKQQVQGMADLGYSQFLPIASLEDLLSPELKKSRFVAFKEKFSEDMYFKKPELGKSLSLPSTPPGFTNENFIYGLKNKPSEKLYDLISPNKSPHEVKQEFIKWHDKYLISHNKYLPSERIERNYNNNFKPQAIYGMSVNSDKSGYRIKKILQHCDRMVVINKAQKQFLDRTTGQLGKKVNRYNFNLDPHQTFGIKTNNQNSLDVRALIENVKPCAKEFQMAEAISYINKLRQFLFNRSDFHMYDLKILLNKYDENETGFIPFNLIMRVLRSLQIHANEKKIHAAILHFQMLKDDNATSELVNTDKFWKMLHIQYPLPRKSVISEINENCMIKETTYRSLCLDREKLVDPQKTPCKLQIDDDITAGYLISPDIPLQYGLSSSDLKVLRPKEEMRRIFKRLLPENFDEIWEFAWPKGCDETSCKMSVNELKIVIDDYNNRHSK